MSELTFGDRLRILFKKNNISQKNIADMLGIEEQSVSQVMKKFDVNKGNLGTYLIYVDKAGFDFNYSFDGISSKEGKIGILLKLAMNKKKLSQKELSKRLNTRDTNVSNALRNLSDNRGNINTLIEYAEKAGIEFKYWFEKK